MILRLQKRIAFDIFEILSVDEVEHDFLRVKTLLSM